NCWVTSSRINSTWGGSVVDMVRSQRYLEIYREDKILDYVANTAGPALYKGLLELQKEFPVLQNVRGKGLMCAYDLPDTETRNKLIKLLHGEKMLILPCGNYSIRYRPALNVPLSDLEKAMEITRKCLKMM
ncbi:MAG: aminotransferase class III-fold pyridoxal phosphate-dependent enzyme, partial [Synergistales bacterium]|nr:aminotransferase class III-fold pyridoxal phosphate-dependent enzyme [Synergistales bacterium]